MATISTEAGIAGEMAQAGAGVLESLRPDQVDKTTFEYMDGERVFWHGSAASRALRTQAECKVCLTVSLLDGIVLSRSAFNHSVNYRSVMLFGTARSVDDSGEKLLALEKLMERIARGRWGEVRQPTELELKATSVLWMDIREGAAKIRAIPVGDEPADRDQPVWAGVVPVITSLGEPEPAAEHVPWGTYDVGVAPTAAVMTSRGIERFDEGKFQEAIDQFTKAIALDPKYVDAWERRAEAYAQLGRPKQAEEDRRHLQGLDPSSSPG